MANLRVYELAKQYNVNNKEIIKILTDHGIEVKSHMSSISADDVKLVKNSLEQKSSGNQTAKKEETVKPQNLVTAKPAPAKPAETKTAVVRNTETQGTKPQADQNGRSIQQGKPVRENRPVSKPAETEKSDRPAKSHITQVYNPQNSSTGKKIMKQKFEPNNQRGTGENAGQRNNSGAQAGRSTGENKKPFQGYRNNNQKNYANSQNNHSNNANSNLNNNSNASQSGYSGNNQHSGQNNQNSHSGNNQNGNQGYNPNGRQGGNQRNFQNNYQGGNRNKDQGSYQKDQKNDNGRSFQKQDRQRVSQKSEMSMSNQKLQADSGVAEQSKKKKNKNVNHNNYNNKQYNENTQQSGKKNKKNVQNVMTKPVAKQPEKVEEVIKEIIIPESLTIKELADHMKVQPSALVKKLFLQGKIVTINQEIDFETAQEIALEYDIIAEMEEKVDIIEELLREDEEDETKLVKRPPVVCVMGHVDHGKTSLLDAIRETNVIAREAGGITQHIGAYTVEINGEQITFLDTPGHEAFTAMRMRGAQSTDIAILVVAADDGVMPQTVEAINHAKAAGIGIIVAVNKIDKPSANVDKVKQELAEYELVAEDWGGDTIFVPVSAHTKEGIDNLLEMILLEAEVLELKANPKRRARGLVIEAQLDKGRGPVATVLVQKGTLRVGDPVAAGSNYGKVRAMINDKGERVSEAGPSTPVEILGLNGIPNAGEVFVSTANEKEARNFAETFIKDGREKLIESSKTKAKMSLDDLFNQIQEGELKELDLIIKADVQGSVEAVKQSLVKLTNEEVVVKVIHAGVGAINESDVILASASNAIIIGFNVRPDNMAKEIAEREGVDLRLYRVIYQAIADVEAAMKGLLDPVFEEKIIGHAIIRQLFKASSVGTIAGSYVTDGFFRRGCKVRITREGEQIYEGDLASLKRFKDDVKEVKANYECGLVFEKFNDIKEDDIVEAYIMEEVPR